MTEADKRDLRAIKAQIYDAISGLKDEMDELQKYTGRKTAKVMSRVLKLEGILKEYDRGVKQ